MNDNRRLPGGVLVLPSAHACWPLLLLAGCATVAANGEAGRHGAERSTDSLTAEIRLAEPGPDEVVVVINNNAAFGNHAGIFAGGRLSDPAGSYRDVRAESPGWLRVSLADYVAYQMVDGLRIQVYRFTLPEAQFSEVVARLPEADSAAPLFCGAAVQNAIAGIGPFQSIETTWWTSPAELARRLASLTTDQQVSGTCLWPDGLPC